MIFEWYNLSILLMSQAIQKNRFKYEEILYIVSCEAEDG